MNEKNQRGSALLAALIFIAVILILGISALIFAEAGAKQSAALIRASENYYAAESNAHVAIQTIIRDKIYYEKLEFDDEIVKIDYSIDKLEVYIKTRGHKFYVQLDTDFKILNMYDITGEEDKSVKKNQNVENKHRYKRA